MERLSELSRERAAELLPELFEVHNPNRGCEWKTNVAPSCWHLCQFSRSKFFDIICRFVPAMSRTVSMGWPQLEAVDAFVARGEQTAPRFDKVLFSQPLMQQARPHDQRFSVTNGSRWCFNNLRANLGSRLVRQFFRYRRQVGAKP
jgi:hypothetical protein